METRFCSLLLAAGLLFGSLAGARADRQGLGILTARPSDSELGEELRDPGSRPGTSDGEVLGDSKARGQRCPNGAESLVEVGDHGADGNKPFDFVTSYPQNKKWTRLGSGAQGTVFQTEVTEAVTVNGYTLTKGSSIAVKKTSESKCQLAEWEWKVAKAVRHPNVLKAFAFSEGVFKSCWLAMEMLESPKPMFYNPSPLAPARSYLEDLDAPAGLRIWRDIVGGYRALCKAGFVHKDPNPDNLVVSCPPSGCSVKIFDFGFAKPLGGDCGTPMKSELCTCRFDVAGMIKQVRRQIYSSTACPPGACAWKEDRAFRSFSDALDAVLSPGRADEWKSQTQALALYDCLLDRLSGQGGGAC